MVITQHFKGSQISTKKGKLNFLPNFTNKLRPAGFPSSTAFSVLRQLLRTTTVTKLPRPTENTDGL